MSLAANPQKRIARTMFFPTPMRTGASSPKKARGSAATWAYAFRNQP